MISASPEAMNLWTMHEFTPIKAIIIDSQTSN